MKLQRARMMKSILPMAFHRTALWLVALWLTACMTAWAQKTTTHEPLKVIPRNAVMLNLGGLTLDYLNMSYYRALDSSNALGVYVGYLYHLVGNERITGYGFGVAYRYYPARRAISRFYYSPIIGIQRGDVVDEDRSPGIGVLISGLVGWQWFPEEVFAVGLAVGGRVILGGKNEDPVIGTAFGASPVITLDLGYGW